MLVSRDHFYRLASDLEDERIHAAKSLLDELTEVNDQQEWNYALDRLIKGLSSSRASARVGYSMCLTELLSILIADKGVYSTRQYLQDLDEKIRVNITKNNGKNERALLFGKLFGYQSILNSTVFVEEKIFQSLDYMEILNGLLELSLSKSWIRETCFFTIYQSLLNFRILPNLLKNKENITIFAFLIDKIHELNLTLTTEGLLIYLAIPQIYRSSFIEENCKNINSSGEGWKNGDPLSKGNLVLLSNVLKDTQPSINTDGSDPEDNKKNNKQQKGNWQARLHYVWKLLINELVNNEIEKHENLDISTPTKENSKKRSKHDHHYNKKSKKSKSSNSNLIKLEDFWKSIVDDQFFATSSSPERKYLGFEIFNLALISLNSLSSIDEHLSTILSPNLIRCLINQAAKPDRLLNSIAKKTLNNIIEQCQKNNLKIIPVLSKLLVPPTGTISFDRLTKTKTCETIISNCKIEDAASLIDFFINWFNIVSKTANNDSENKNDSSSIQHFIVDQLLHIVRNQKASLVPENIESVVGNILDLLIVHGYFDTASADLKEEANNNNNISKTCQDRLNSILSEIISIKTKDNVSWPYKILQRILKHENDSSKWQLKTKFDEELDLLKQESLLKLKEIINLKSEKSTLQLECFELLFSMSILQVYAGDEESIGVIQELTVAFDKIFNFEDESGNTQSESIEMLLEIVLSFISQKSALLKRLSLLVWENLSKDLTAANFDMLYDILLTKENKEGQDKLFKGIEENTNAEEEDEEHKHDHNEEGESGSDSSSEEEEQEHQEEEQEEEEDDDDDDENDDGFDNNSEKSEYSNNPIIDEVDKRTNIALAKALGIPTSESGAVKFSDDDNATKDNRDRDDGNEDEDDDDNEDEDSDDESMSDEQMMALDFQLSRIFKERQESLTSIQNSSKSGNKRKQEAEDARENMGFLKNRILDLLEKFSDLNPHSYLNLSMILPLLKLIELTLNKKLGEKAHRILKTKICKLKIITDKNNDSPFNNESLLTLLEEIQALASNSKITSHSLACNQSCVFIVKTILNNTGDKNEHDRMIDKIIGVYVTSLKRWVQNKNDKIQPSMYFDFINWLNTNRNKN
ncbi:hypothetical protein PACTADRAFT_48137 [Pachysolen tannophilus NRRL Y-2460]|uniref:DNA polymerase V n=1 Tax=Pachysolen tannophilus NRRL Y-2460 TaxID=669874 RepID=A0A1E4U2Z5_PACTA|nr:hypothetical protein PACTADRAFT_48137 [Pachysolen tannophilus NRRL Y-2460]